MQMMAESLPSILQKLNNQNFSVINKMADFDWFTLFGKSTLTINGREAGGLSLTSCFAFRRASYTVINCLVIWHN